MYVVTINLVAKKRRARMGSLTNKTAIITGGSRGIGREIAIRLGKEGANVVLAAKTVEPHKFLAGTIGSVAKEVENAGGKALPLQLDVRDADAIASVARAAFDHFKSIDMVVNNAGAIYLSDTLSTDAKQFDLMLGVNVRATFLMSRACIPFMKNGGHILNLSPPIKLASRWLAPHVAYTISKYGMSMCTLGMAEELREQHIGVNSLWPRTIIHTAAITRLMGDGAERNCRKPAVLADAAAWIFSQNPQEITGNLFLDEEVLARAGIKDLSSYDCVKDGELLPDLYVE
jgi:citronellol/citronellal dehydrogenase